MGYVGMIYIAQARVSSYAPNWNTTYLATLRPRKNLAMSWSLLCQGKPRARTMQFPSTSSSIELQKERERGREREGKRVKFKRNIFYNVLNCSQVSGTEREYKFQVEMTACWGIHREWIVNTRSALAWRRSSADSSTFSCCSLPRWLMQPGQAWHL